MRIIKSYNILTEECRKHDDLLTFDEDRAVADCRAFFVIASLHTTRVTNTLAKNVMREIFETLLDDLADK